jgi:16S rRNA G527 N7-methylase RsmG
VNSNDSSPTRAFLSAYSAEILRWNRKINLVSRQDTEALLRDLFRQSLDGGRALWSFLEEVGWVKVPHRSDIVYFDLGSGGGIPGAIWHNHFSGMAGDLQTWLVEPREKRAWFLERVSGEAGSAPFGVCCGRWGEVENLVEASDSDPIIVISMKALHLTDSQVLEGLVKVAPSLESGRIAISRFYPAGQVLDQCLVQHLGIVPEGQRVYLGNLGVAGAGSRVLNMGGSGPRKACLVLSLYK